MSNRIGWCDVTINPFAGCSHVSEGCRNCYAEQMAGRLAGIPSTKERYSPLAYLDDSQQFSRKTVGRWTGKVWTASPDELDKMFKKLGKKPKAVFVGSMGDLFHPAITKDFVLSVFRYMEAYYEHKYIILTKRPERIIETICSPSNRFDQVPILSNVHIGVSVEDQVQADKRIPELIRFNDLYKGSWSIGISAEPLLGRLDISAYTPRLKWVIAGSETGKNARPADREWFEKLSNRCYLDNIPFYLKQMGTRQGESGMPYQRQLAWRKNGI